MTKPSPASSLSLIGPSAFVLALASLGCAQAAGGSTLDGTGNGAAGSDILGGSGGGGASFIDPNQSGSDAADDANPCGTTIPVLYRDMKFSTEPGGHPDFENFVGQDDIGCGIVQSILAADHTPVFQASYGSAKRLVNNGVFDKCVPWDYVPSMTIVQSATTFQSWYHTDPQFSKEVKGTLALAETPAGSGKYVYDSAAFFPIDNQGWGNSPGQSHNFSFTTEIHLLFGYVSGQKFTFRGDDDLWIFVNNKLALDLGGCHNALEATIDFDAQAAALGITRGETYPMDIFHAERHTTASNFRLETNISCFQPAIYDIK
jgi:fibro-slime domain-containing protein